MTFELTADRSTDVVDLLNDLNRRGELPDAMMQKIQNWIYAEETLKRVLAREAPSYDTPAREISVKETTIPAHTRVVPYRMQVFVCEGCGNTIQALGYPGRLRTKCDTCAGRKPRKSSQTIPYGEAKRRQRGRS